LYFKFKMSGLLSQLVKDQNYYNNLNNRKMSECHDNMNHNSRIAQTIEQINQDLKTGTFIYNCERLCG